MSATDNRMKVTCPGCGAVRPVSPRMAGLAVVCRGCGRPVRVPTADDVRGLARPLAGSAGR